MRQCICIYTVNVSPVKLEPIVPNSDNHCGVEVLA